MRMKPSSPESATKTPDRATARNAALLNLAATPGLGSIMAGRRVAGIGQLILAVAGFGMVLGWFVKLMRDYFSLISDQPGEPQVSFGWLQAGAAVIAAAWLWSLVTSLQIIRSVPKNLPSTTPPRLG